MNSTRLLFLALGIILLMTSCNLPSQAVPAPTAELDPTETPVPSPTFTPTPSPPSLSASIELPCRVGPGDHYDLIVNLQTAEKVEMVGKAEAYWIVKSPSGVECWVADQQVNIEGEVSVLPNVNPPPTPVPAIPAPPEHVGLISQTCSIDNSTKPVRYVNEFRLTWKDMSNNEDGFRVYRDGNLVAEVPANRTDVVDVISQRNNTLHYYYVTAYNEVGASKSEAQAFSCGK